MPFKIRLTKDSATTIWSNNVHYSDHRGFRQRNTKEVGVVISPVSPVPLGKWFSNDPYPIIGL